MAARPLLLRGRSLLRFYLLHHRHPLRLDFLSHNHHRTCSIATESTRTDENSHTATTTTGSSASLAATFNLGPSMCPRLDDPDYGKWKVKEAEILRDVEPIILLTKDILHSDRYRDGERLTVEDEKAVVDKLLAHHPHAEDKIGCGLYSIMVNRHPQFRTSRCLFVVRTDGGVIDFSYRKCLQAYIRDKYPSHAERFIIKHLNRRCN